MLQLTAKNTDHEREIERFLARKGELEDQIGDINNQLEKKDFEINELNTKLNDKTAAVQNLLTNKQILDNQLVSKSKNNHFLV